MSEQKYLKYCPNCAKTENIVGAKYHVKGYKNFYDSDEYKTCLECNSNLIQLSMSCGDYRILTHISTEPNFIENMIKLLETDPIEYQLKLSQFKETLYAQQQAKIQADNRPKCITCGSTNIKKISTTSKVAGATMFGLFSKTAKSQFKCESCGCKW